MNAKRIKITLALEGLRISSERFHEEHPSIWISREAKWLLDWKKGRFDLSVKEKRIVGEMHVWPGYEFVVLLS